MDTLTTIRTKRAVRQFAAQPVPDDIIHAILDAGRRSQSSKNTQPWQFIVIRDRDTLQQLSTAGKFAGHLAGADFAIAIVASTPWAFDVGQAAAYLQLAAWDQGVGSCIASIYERDRAREILDIPPDQYFEVALSFGYPAPDFKPAKMGGRRPVDDVVRWEKW